MPTVVVKYPVQPKPKRVFIAAVKSTACTLPYEVALALKKPCDSLKVLWVYDEDAEVDKNLADMKEVRLCCSPSVDLV